MAFTSIYHIILMKVLITDKVLIFPQCIYVLNSKLLKLFFIYRLKWLNNKIDADENNVKVSIYFNSFNNLGCKNWRFHIQSNYYNLFFINSPIKLSSKLNIETFYQF